jgi:hypothetical protein
MRTHLFAILGLAVFTVIVVALGLGPDMASGAPPLAPAFGGSNGIPMEVPGLW